MIICIFAAILLDCILQSLVALFQIHLKRKAAEEPDALERFSGKPETSLLYRDLAGGLGSLDNIIKAFTGTLVGSWITHLLHNDYTDQGSPLFYITVPLWVYILAVHLSARMKRTGGGDGGD